MGLFMITFFIDMVKLLHAVMISIKHDIEFRILLFFLLTLLVGATLFYSSVEGWSIIDALYFSVMTMSTIGYGDLVPTTTWSKSFTIIFSILSISFFAAVIAKIVANVLERKKNKIAKHKERASDKNNKK
jgi:voltage-gated potassium channel Kch